MGPPTVPHVPPPRTAGISDSLAIRRACSTWRQKPLPGWPLTPRNSIFFPWVRSPTMCSQAACQPPASRNCTRNVVPAMACAFPRSWMARAGVAGSHPVQHLSRSRRPSRPPCASSSTCWRTLRKNSPAPAPEAVVNPLEARRQGLFWRAALWSKSASATALPAWPCWWQRDGQVGVLKVALEPGLNARLRRRRPAPAHAPPSQYRRTL